MPDHPVDGPDLPPEGLLGTAYNLETGEETLAHYQRWAATYDQEVGVDNGYAQPARCAAALDEATDRPGSVLDVGCGTGLSGIALRDVGFTDLDLDMPILGTVRRRGSVAARACGARLLTRARS